MLMFRRRRFTDLLLRGSPPGTVGACSPNGWVDSELFVQWLSHFIAVVKPCQAKKVILIVDGHTSHKTLAAVELARRNGVVMLSLPPHTTHRLQPLDRTIFGPLKSHYNNECDKWMVTHPGQRIGQYDVASLFGLAYLKACTMDKAISGFRCTGLYPFNPDIFTDDDFLPSMVTDEPGPNQPAGDGHVSSDQPVSMLHAVINSISPLPKCDVKRTRKRKSQGALLLTGSPFKQALVKQTSVEKKLCQKKPSESKSKTDMQKRKKEKKKMMTCRANKPRGRKPKTEEACRSLTKPNAKNSKRKCKSVCQSGDGSNPECILCGELLSASRSRERWIQCAQCCGWCHYACTSGETSRGYVCDFCH